MAPSDDFFEKGSLYASDVNVTGAGGGLNLTSAALLSWSMQFPGLTGLRAV